MLLFMLRKYINNCLISFFKRSKKTFVPAWIIYFQTKLKCAKKYN